jgi:hypothetical protein
VTANFEGGQGSLVCRTRNISITGIFLDTPVVIHAGTRVELSLMDEGAGEVLQLEGEVVRSVESQGEGKSAGLGIKLLDPPPTWGVLFDRAKKREKDQGGGPMSKRLRVLVVGDEERRRGAIALYVTSGWDVRFASDLDDCEEALQGFRIDAIIAEHELDDGRWPQILEAARRTQPDARRVIRAPLHGSTAPPAGRPTDLVHRVVDVDAGLDAVVDALTYDLSAPPAA